MLAGARESADRGNEFLSGVWRHRDCHGVRVYDEPEDGQCFPEDLLVCLVWDSQLVPRFQTRLFIWERFVVPCVQGHAVGEIPGIRIVDVCEEVSDETNIDGDPHDQSKKGTPASFGTTVSEIVTAVNAVHPVDGDDLKNLPKRCEWLASIHSRYVRFEDDEVDVWSVYGAYPEKRRS